MALIMALPAAGQPEWLCSPAGQASPLHGMTVMHLLMTAFHSARWWKLLAFP